MKTVKDLLSLFEKADAVKVKRNKSSFTCTNIEVWGNQIVLDDVIIYAKSPVTIENNNIIVQTPKRTLTLTLLTLTPMILPTEVE